MPHRNWIQINDLDWLIRVRNNTRCHRVHGTSLQTFLERVSAFSPVFILFSGPGRTGRETRRLLFGLAIAVGALLVDEEFDCGLRSTLPRLTITGQSSRLLYIHSYSQLFKAN